MKKLITFLFLSVTIMPSQVFAQMAAASLFSEMKSINPAVILGRQKGQYTLVGTKDNYEKTQDISEAVDAELESEITGFSFFRGGKMGGLITTELTLISQAGERDIKFRGSDPIDMTSEVNFTYTQFAFSLGQHLGFAITNQSYKLDQKFSLDMGGTLLESDEEITRDSVGMKVGLVYPIGILRLAAYYEVVNADQEVKSERPALPESSTSPENIFVGVGVGVVTPNFHFEVSVEQFQNPELGLLEPEDADDPDPRTRMSLTVEGKVFGITLGYTGRQYNDGYLDQEQTVTNQLVFGNSLESRIEHIVNFSLGGESGLSFGGSFSISEVEGEEPSPIEPAALENKYDTTSKHMGVMAKVGYVW